MVEVDRRCEPSNGVENVAESREDEITSYLKRSANGLGCVWCVVKRRERSVRKTLPVEVLSWSDSSSPKSDVPPGITSGASPESRESFFNDQ